MTAPQQAALRFLWALGLGMAAGALYGFLRPLRPRHTASADLLFVLALWAAWIWHSFGICGADIRPGNAAALLLGALLFDRTAGQLLKPGFAAFWHFWALCTARLTAPCKNFFKKLRRAFKKLLASGKKSGTISDSTRLHARRKSGGKIHGRKTEDPSGLLQKQSGAESDLAGAHRPVHRGTADAAQRHRRRASPG